MANTNRGRLTVNLAPCADRAPGLQTIGTVKRGDGEATALGVNDAGEYFAFLPGERPEPLPLAKVQSAIAAAATGMCAPSQADRMIAKAERRRAHAEREALKSYAKTNGAKPQQGGKTGQEGG